MKKAIISILVTTLLLGMAFCFQVSAAAEGTPEANPKGGEFNSTVNVTLTTSLAGGTIYYTTDGSAPTTSSTVYTEPIYLYKTTTIRAAAKKAGASTITSGLMTETYTISIGRPTASPKGGTYFSTQFVTLSTTFTNGKIYYTSGGATPTKASTEYTGPIMLNMDTTIKAIAVSEAMGITSTSGVMTEEYKFDGLPVADIKGGTYDTSQKVTLSSQLGVSTLIRYTLDGSAPTKNSTKYDGPITISKNTTLKAAYFFLSEQRGSMMSETYEFKSKNPVASPAGGSYNAEQTVTLTSGTAGALIYYTTDGTQPTAGAEDRYNAPFKVSKTTTVKAIAVKLAGLTTLYTSDTVTITYTITTTGEPPLPAGSMDNFLSKNTYTRGQFTDVDETQWYGFDNQKVIADAYGYGLMKGNSATTFNPTGNVTLAEAITMAARVHSIYTTGTDDFTQGSPWYQVYVDYAIAKGIIASGDFPNYTRAATRGEMAHIFYKSLPASEFAEKNTVNSLPDVNSGTQYYASILALYKAGVLTGSDAKGTFNPGKSITRAEAAAIISRVALPAKRASGKTF